MQSLSASVHLQVVTFEEYVAARLPALPQSRAARQVHPAIGAGRIDRAWGALDDVAIELAPRRWRSWTGSVLQAETSKQLDMPYEDVWIPTDG
jgi:hypothetical protein